MCVRHCLFFLHGSLPSAVRAHPVLLLALLVASLASQVTLNGQQYDQVGVFTYYDPPIFSYITPPSGPTRGGTQCTLRARGLAANVQPGLDGAHQYFCIYGRHGRVTASYVADETLRCDTPAALDMQHEHDPGTVQVTVTINDQGVQAEAPHDLCLCLAVDSLTRTGCTSPCPCALLVCRLSRCRRVSLLRRADYQRHPAQHGAHLRR